VAPLPDTGGDLGHDDRRGPGIGEQGGALDAIEEGHRIGPGLGGTHREGGECGVLDQPGRPETGLFGTAAARLGDFAGGSEPPSGESTAQVGQVKSRHLLLK
jgi:hypothetical protein